MLLPGSHHNNSTKRIFRIVSSVLLINTVLGLKCPTQILPLLQSNITTVWASKNIRNEIVTSYPPCADYDDNLVTRICTTDASWYPDPFQGCSKIMNYRRCPMNFEETSETCRFISEPRPWGNICSFDGLSQNSSRSTLENELVWMPYKRTTKYGPHESTTRGEDYRKPFNKPLNASLTDPDFFNKHCLIMNTSSELYFPEFCDNEHKHVCDFGKKDANERCRKEGCLSADIFTKKCYCKQKQLCPSRLAKIQNVYDLTVLLDLADDDVCNVDSDLVPDIGKPQALGKNAWYYSDTTLNYSLCVSQTLRSGSQGNAEMVLNFDDQQVKLFLTIYSPGGLFGEGKENMIYCYTNAAQFDLIKKVKVELILQNNQASRAYNVYQLSLEKHIGSYWCEAFKDENSEQTVASNSVLAYKEKNGNEFSWRLTITSICILFSCDEAYYMNFNKVFDEIDLTDLRSKIRVMEILRFDFVSIDLILHITTEHNYSVIDEYNRLEKEIEAIPGIENSDFKSSEYCLPDTSHNLTWPLTRMGQSAVAEEMCLQENGLPVTRICKGEFLTGAQWSDVVGECNSDVEVPESAKYILSILNETLSKEIITNVINFVKTDINLPALSVYMVSKFMDNIFYQLNTTNFDPLTATLDITEHLLNVNKNSLVNAQALLNATDDVLDLVDNIFTTTTIQSKEVFLMQRHNLIVHVTNPFLSGVSGLVVYQEGDNEPVVENLLRNSTFEDVGADAVVAVIVPEELINQSNTTNLTIVTTIYFKDTFFQTNDTKKPSGAIISVTIPEYGCYLPTTIPIMFKITNTSEEPDCGFWDYGKKTIRSKGRWSTVGGNYLGNVINHSTYHICAYSHLTHFSLLSLTIDADLSPIDDSIMDVIFYLGDALTMFGVAGIFATAIMFTKWRRKQGTVILLNLSVAILLEVFLMQITDTKVPFAPQGCGVLGIFLHYIIISKFCWMLVYSFLQYMRFVRVLSVLPENIVVKSVIFGWGFAIIPVTIVNVITRAAYTKKKYNFCYPTGLYLYLGTLLPVAIIICINTYVFIRVMREVTSKNVESHGSKENIYKLQVQLAILLFFVLGVPWLFFVFASLIPIYWLRLTLAYLFCVTSNFQGFILFLFYVVFNTETRESWIGYFSKKRPKSFSISTKLSSRS